MVRTVKPSSGRSLGKGEQAVIMPGTSSLEAWEIWPLREGMTDRLLAGQSLRELQLKGAVTFAIPMSQVICVPLWLQETDEKQFRGMIQLQLELRGLPPRNGDLAVFDFTIIIRDEKRTLVLVAVLPPNLIEEVQQANYPAFDFCARFYTYPENALVLWREQGQLVMALTRGDQLVYGQTLKAEHLTVQLLQDLSCMMNALALEGVTLPLREVVLWTQLDQTEVSALQQMMMLPVRETSRPLPKAPSGLWRLMPATVVEALKSREARRWRIRAALAVAGLYLFAVVILAGRLFWTSHQVDQLNRWADDHVAPLDQMHATQAAWKELTPVLDEKNYPLELLLHVSDALPAEQLHLTLFEVSNGRILIKGEAKNAAAAFQFLGKLKSSPELGGYTWNMGQPRLLPNDLAQLQIEGTYGPAN